MAPLIALALVLFGTAAHAAPVEIALPEDADASGYHEVVLSTCYQFGDMDIRVATLEKAQDQVYLKLEFPYVAFEEVLILIWGNDPAKPVYEKNVTREKEVTGTVVSNYVPAASFKGEADLVEMRKNLEGAWEGYQAQHSIDTCKPSPPPQGRILPRG